VADFGALVCRWPLQLLAARQQAAGSHCRPGIQRQLLVGAHGRATPGAIVGTPNDSLFFQLELNDFGSIGANPIGLLRRSIPGYGKINELPTSSNLLTP
jgi:LPS-assembly protein